MSKRFQDGPGFTLIEMIIVVIVLLGKVSDMEAMRWTNTSPLPMIVFRHEKYRLETVTLNF
jgi:prepilin-type N-terminal cleavage/methylation domain-containing protein